MFPILRTCHRRLPLSQLFILSLPPSSPARTFLYPLDSSHFLFASFFTLSLSRMSCFNYYSCRTLRILRDVCPNTSRNVVHTISALPLNILYVVVHPLAVITLSSFHVFFPRRWHVRLHSAPPVYTVVQNDRRRTRSNGSTLKCKQITKFFFTNKLPPVVLQLTRLINFKNKLDQHLLHFNIRKCGDAVS